MKTDIAFIHTTSLVLDPVKQYTAPLSDRFDFYHILDESLLRCMMTGGNRPELTVPWLGTLVDSARKGGAAGAIVSCSSLSTSVNEVSEMTGFPLAAIDTALYRHVRDNCDNPAVLMTNPTNREPAAFMQKEAGMDVPVFICPGAFESLQRGEKEKHDGQVVDEIVRLLQSHDAVLLSQISMERVRSLLPETLGKRVFSSLDFIERTIEDLLR